ncbi:MAG: ABC-2 family transporter protein [Clostridia bacterium]|nr:ABC-2 family transporter protein [Clostridia bacterium]
MKKISNLTVYRKFLSIHLRSLMQYKASFIMTLLGQFSGAFSAFLTIYFLLRRFGTVEGYTYQEVLLCFASIYMAFSLAETFARGLDRFPAVIGNGEFDRILVRPRNEIFQVIASKTELTRLGRLLQAIVTFCYAIPASGIDFTPDKILCLVLMVVCGALVFVGVFVIFAFICFFTLEGLEFMNILTDGVREHGSYPFDIYGKEIMTVMTFVVPYTLVQVYPLHYLIGRTDSLLNLFAPLLALVFLIPCALLWKLGVRHYKSTGS